METVLGKIERMPAHSSAIPQVMRSLQWRGLTVVESCTQTHKKQGKMFLENHLLLFVLEGEYIVAFGEDKVTVKSGEMVLLQKSILVAYEKTGLAGSHYKLDYMMFFISDDLLRQFVRMADIKEVEAGTAVPVSVRPMNDRLMKYVQSVKPYFDDEPGTVSEGLIELKLLELLYDIAHADNSFLAQILQLKQRERRSIAEIVRENLFLPVSVQDLAYLSGRSLSVFKREFKEMFNSSPMHWIRNARLEKAKSLLGGTAMSVTDIGFAVGFEEAAHFSKSFKERFGSSPSAYRELLRSDGPNRQQERPS